ncbi:TPA: hypothetical protein ACGUOS_003762 [Vibrio vulnificus]|uniref:hypothetical protein n=1 Tax=Vibrio parahaemolyticus TaxID=670 RepID=UPI00111DCDE6|nr:hypothetical protein [Vibrio parahaemolyticus]TOA23192.1 hypothetical protein CGK32_16440 [Vibrio parahaemolyticus]HDY8038883.1 hypothetical protein [Vibrio vulnificus]
MTTTVYDVSKLHLTSDSRWSAEVYLEDGTYLLYVDNTGFNKLANRLGGVLVLAGDGELISEWKAWWTAEGDLDVKNMPSVALDKIRMVSVMIVSKESGDILFDAGPKLAYADESAEKGRTYLAVFSGSGQQYAANCWWMNRCSRTAVSSAAANDPCTGGDVKYINCTNNENNLQDENFDYTSIKKSLTERGMLMKLADKNVIPLDQHAQGAEIKDKVANGSIRASAPTGMESTFKWDDARLEKLNQAVNKVAEIESRMLAM